MQCPQCGSACYDNRAKIAAGDMKPNAPLFVCTDKTGCGWKKWPEKQPGRQQAGPGMPQQSAQRPAGARSPGTWADMKAVYERCVSVARKAWGVDDKSLPTDGICASANTLFIEANKRGLQVTTAPIPAPKPVRAPVLEDFEEMPEALEGQEDDLPW